MSTVNTVADMIREVDNSRGLITLWRPDNSKADWFCRKGDDPNSLMEHNKFAFFQVPYPLEWANNNGKGEFWANKVFHWVNRKQDFNGGDVSNIFVDHKGKHHLQDGGKGKTTEFWHADPVDPVKVGLQTHPVIWLPFCEVPSNEYPNHGSRIVFFNPLQDGVLS